jgi:hypothetical protein
MALFEKSLNKKLSEALGAEGELPEFMDKDEALNWIWQQFEKGGRSQVLIPLPDPEVQPVQAVVFNSETWDYSFIEDAEAYAREMQQSEREHQERMKNIQLPPK